MYKWQYLRKTSFPESSSICEFSKNPDSMLGGLNAIATLELFTQNYFKYGRISFTMRQRIKFWVYPPGARLFRPLPLFVQRLYIFWKILDLIRIWSDSDPDLICTFFVEKMCGSDPDQIQNLKKYFKHVSSHQRHRKPFTIIAPPGDDKLNKSFVEPRNLKNCHSTPSMYRVIYWLELYTVIADQSRIRSGSDTDRIPKIFWNFKVLYSR